MATPDQEQTNTVNEVGASAPPPPALDAAAAEKLIAGWKKLYLLFKPIETKLDAARKKVTDLLVAAGFEPGDSFVSKHGKISLQEKTSIDWEGLARHVISDKVIASLLPSFTKKSASFVRAPATWTGEAKS